MKYIDKRGNYYKSLIGSIMSDIRYMISTRKDNNQINESTVSITHSDKDDCPNHIEPQEEKPIIKENISSSLNKENILKEIILSDNDESSIIDGIDMSIDMINDVIDNGLKE